MIVPEELRRSGMWNCKFITMACCEGEMIDIARQEDSSHLWRLLFLDAFLQVVRLRERSSDFRVCKVKWVKHSRPCLLSGIA